MATSMRVFLQRYYAVSADGPVEDFIETRQVEGGMLAGRNQVCQSEASGNHDLLALPS